MSIRTIRAKEVIPREHDWVLSAISAPVCLAFGVYMMPHWEASLCLFVGGAGAACQCWQALIGPSRKQRWLFLLDGIATLGIVMAQERGIAGFRNRSLAFPAMAFTWMSVAVGLLTAAAVLKWRRHRSNDRIEDTAA